MAAKKKKKSSRPKKKAGPDLAAQIRKLESRLRALEASPVQALRDVLTVDGGRACKTVLIKGNLQIVNGMGRTDTTNGCGNLIVGYNELPPPSSDWSTARTGSHNIILGRYHSHASYAGLLSGEMNRTTAAAPSACVVGGSEGSVNGDRSVVIGGHEGKANSARCVVMGGFDNGSNGATLSVVIGGTNNRADGAGACIFGGRHNTAGGSNSTITGGVHNTTTLPDERIPP